MRRLLSLCLTLSLLAVACGFLTPRPAPVSPAAPTVSPQPSASPTTASPRAAFRDGLVQADQSILNGLQGANEYQLTFTLLADLLHVDGQETIRYTNTEEVLLDKVELRFFPNLLGGEMTVSNVRVDDASVTPEFGLNDSLLIVPLNPPLEPGQSATLSIDFQVTLPSTVDQVNYGVLAYSENVLALAHAYPMVAVYNEEGWNAEVPPPSGDVTFSDMAFFTVTVRAPKDLVLVAVGRETSRQVEGDQQVVTYEAGPVRDFYLAASPAYEVVSRQVGETTVNFYAPHDLRNGAQAGLDAAVRALEDFSARYAPYPYTELDLVATPTLALGIEYPGMIAINQRIVDPTHGFLEGTVAHEVGHQWFYNLVGNDQLDHPWLDESLTQFVTLEYFFDEYGSQGYQGFRESLTARWDQVNDQPIPIGLPVAGYSDQEYSAIVYGRGPLFFEALKNQMGAKAFDAFLRDYTVTYSWGIATPKGLKALAERHCNCDLTPLFEEWVNP